METNSEFFRQQQPQPSSMSDLNWQIPKAETLDCGAKLIYLNVPGRQMVNLSVYFDTGNVSEGLKAGSSELAGDLLSRGAGKRSHSEFKEAIEGIGAMFSSSADSLQISVLKKYVIEAFDLFFDALLAPTWDIDELELLRLQNISALTAMENSPGELTSRLLKKLIFPDKHPRGEVITKRSISNIHIKDCINYYSNYLIPDTACFLIEGDLNLDWLITTLNSKTNTWRSKAFQKSFYGMIAPPNLINVGFAERTGAVQSSVQMANPIEFNINKPDYLSGLVMNMILGSSFSGRLNMKLREEKGYTYGITSRLIPDEETGLFSTGTHVKAESTIPAIFDILDEINRIMSEPVNSEELLIAKSLIRGEFVRSFEKPSTFSRMAYALYKYKLPPDFYQNYLSNLEEISTDDVLKAANKYLKPKEMCISVTGNRTLWQELNKHSDHWFLTRFEASDLF